MKKKPKVIARQRIEVEPIFGDFFELEHICGLLREQAKVADAPAGHPVHENGPVGYLRKRVQQQWRAQAREIEAEHPGLFPRTYLDSIYVETDAMLERVERAPSNLPRDMPRLELLLHKLYILPLRNFEEVQQELRRAKAEEYSARSIASHLGRKKMKEKSEEIFLAADKQWDSLAAAAKAIAPDILKMKVLRPLAAGNAVRTITEWLSKLVHSDLDAAQKLSQAARERLSRR